MALALEGTPVHGNATSGSSIVAAAFTTTVATEVFIAATINGSTISSITGGGLTWALRKRQNNGSAQPVELWAAQAGSALSGVQFTVNFAGAVSFTTIDVFAFSGQDTSTIWDANAAVPAGAAASTVSISTSNADDVIIGAARMGGVQNPTQAAGFTKISGADFQLTEYKIVSATQSGLSVGVGLGDPDAFIADALMQASAATGAGRLVGGNLVGGSLVGSLA